MTFHTPLFLATRSKTTKEKGGRGGKILKVHLHVCHTCYVHACPPLSLIWGFSGGSVVKESTCQCRRHGFNPCIRKTPWRRKWQPTPVFLPGKSHRQRSLVGCSPWGCKESDTTKRLSTHTCKLPMAALEIFLQERISFSSENLQDQLQHSRQGHLLRQPQTTTSMAEVPEPSHFCPT